MRSKRTNPVVVDLDDPDDDFVALDGLNVSSDFKNSSRASASCTVEEPNDADRVDPRDEPMGNAPNQHENRPSRSRAVCVQNATKNDDAANFCAALSGALQNPNTTEYLGYLIARLEKNRCAHSGLFRTKWGRDNFLEGLKGINPLLVKNGFDVDEWFRVACIDFYRADSAGSGRCGEDDEDDDDVMSNGGNIKADWLSLLVRVEKYVCGFISLLYGVLKLEDVSHERIANLSDRNRYDTAHAADDPTYKLRICN